MFIFVFFATVIVFSIALNIYFKLQKYRRSDHALWMDGDSVVVKTGEKKDQQEGFEQRLDVNA